MTEQVDSYDSGVSGADLIQSLRQRYPGQDWIAELGKAMVLPRRDVEGMLTGRHVPSIVLDAVATLPARLKVLNLPSPVS